MKLAYLLLPLSVVVVSACSGPDLDYGPEPTLSSYTEPSQSGLSAIEPYPSGNSVCQRIREHDAIREAPDDGSILIACPKHETNAINDQVDLGAEIWRMPFIGAFWSCKPLNKGTTATFDTSGAAA